MLSTALPTKARAMAGRSSGGRPRPRWGVATEASKPSVSRMMINCSSLAASGSISSATCGNSWSCRPIQPPTYRTVSSPMVTPSPPRGHELKSLYRTGKSFSPPFLKQGTHTTIYSALSFVASRHLFCNWLNLMICFADLMRTIEISSNELIRPILRRSIHAFHPGRIFARCPPDRSILLLFRRAEACDELLPQCRVGPRLFDDRVVFIHGKALIRYRLHKRVVR